MYDMDRKEYEEYYGEHVGTCSIHGAVLDTCELCEMSDDETLLGEPEWRSECCSAYPIGELDESTIKYGGPSGFCGHCKDNCIFEDVRND
jgi:hypothetical protein